MYNSKIYIMYKVNSQSEKKIIKGKYIYIYRLCIVLLNLFFFFIKIVNSVIGRKMNRCFKCLEVL